VARRQRDAVGRDQGCPALHPPPVDDTEDVAFRGLVDLGRGLVGDEERRVGRERHRERPPRQFPARQCAGQRRGAVLQADGLEQFFDPEPVAAAGQPRLQSDIVGEVQVTEQVPRLHHDPDRPGPNGGAFDLGPMRHCGSRDRHRPSPRFVESGRAIEERGLAASRRSDQRDGLAPADFERGALQGRDLHAASAEKPEQVRDVEDRSGQFHRNDSATSLH